MCNCVIVCALAVPLFLPAPLRFWPFFHELFFFALLQTSCSLTETQINALTVAITSQVPRIPFISIWKISSPVHPTSFVSLCCCLPFGGAWSAATLLKISYNWLAVNAVPPPPCPRKETSPTPTHFCGIQLKAKTAPPLLRAYLSDLS